MNDGPVIKPGPRTCNPEVPTQKCDPRRRAESLGTMRFNQQARGWEYPVPLVRKRCFDGHLQPVETWEVCPFCLVPLPADEVPKYARQLPYHPPQQPDNPK